jgi:hypothetical protein
MPSERNLGAGDPTSRRPLPPGLPDLHPTSSNSSSQNKEKFESTGSQPAQDDHLPPWPTDEINSLRKKLCTTVPPPDSTYWQQNQIWVGCTNINPRLTSSHPDSLVGDLEVTIKIETIGESDDLWAFYQKNEDALRQAIQAASEGSCISVAGLNVTRGSVTILLIIALVKAAVSLGSIILGFLSFFINYDKFKVGINDAKVDFESFIDKLLYRLRSIFGTPRTAAAGA